MKGKVIMRFVGNRQEPEEHPVPLSVLRFDTPWMPWFDEYLAWANRAMCAAFGPGIMIDVTKKVGSNETNRSAVEPG
jgi:hypothetical protein